MYGPKFTKLMAAPAAPTPFSVEGKTAIVTGAGSGINLAFAKLLLSKGCNVLFADIALRPEAQDLISQYSSPSSKPRAVFQETDVTSWKDLNAMFAAALKEFNSYDIVCPGAGVFEPHWSNFWHPPGAKIPSSQSVDDPEGGRYKSLDINITHPIRCTQLAIVEFLSPSNANVAKASPMNPKRVVHISSIAGQVAGPATPLYVAAKHAISGFVRSLKALEPATGIRVAGVAPGLIKTPLWTDHPEKMIMVDEKSDIWATAEETAEAMLKLCEDETMIGGTVLEVGAGQTRMVKAFMDPGPSGDGHKVSGMSNAVEEVFGWIEEEGWGK